MSVSDDYSWDPESDDGALAHDAGHGGGVEGGVGVAGEDSGVSEAFELGVGEGVAGLDHSVPAASEDGSLLCEHGAEGFASLRVAPFSLFDRLPEEFIISVRGEGGPPVRFR